MDLLSERFPWLGLLVWPAIIVLFFSAAAGVWLSARTVRLHAGIGWLRRGGSPRRPLRPLLLSTAALIAAAFLLQASSGETLAVRVSAVAIAALVAWVSVDVTWKQIRDSALRRAALHRDWTLRAWSARSELAGLLDEGAIHLAACRVLADNLGCTRVLLYVRSGDGFRPVAAAPAAPAPDAAKWPGASLLAEELAVGARFRPLVLSDAARGHALRWARASEESLAAEQERLHALEAHLAVPLQKELRLTGFFLLTPPAGGGPYGPHHLAFAACVAEETARALEAAPQASAAARRAIEKAVEDARHTSALSARTFLAPPENPELPDLEFAGDYAPGNREGGVLYDALALPGRSAAFFAAEIAGPPEIAAVRLIQLQALLRTRARAYHEDLAELVASTRRALSLPDPSLPPVALFCARYATGSRRLRYVNAGLFPPILFRRTLQGAQVLRLRQTGPPLAAAAELRIEETEIEFAPGDLLLAVSSTVPAAANPQGEAWGEVRLIESLLDWKPAPAAEILARSTAALHGFTSGAAAQPARMFLLLRPRP